MKLSSKGRTYSTRPESPTETNFFVVLIFNQLVARSTLRGPAEEIQTQAGLGTIKQAKRFTESKNATLMKSLPLDRKPAISFVQQP